MRVAETCTGPLPLLYPVAAAVMLAEPKLTPVTFGCVAGVNWPAVMVTLAGETVTLDVSLLVRVTVTSLADI